ncbi:MAG: hypothetical protein QOD88_1461 [Mycobacterium sp.]|jgi:hypothetical protein|nr:hypothetical protein [Mycobacterium sp.]
MLETAAMFIGVAIAKKALDRVGEHTGDAFVASLHKLGQWVREKVMSRPTGQMAVEMIASAPAGEAGDGRRDDGRELLTRVLTEITDNDPAAASELQRLVTELEKLAPPDLVVKGDVVVGDVIGGSVTGVEVVGQPSRRAKVDGRVNIDTANGTTIKGSSVKFGP